MFEKTETLSKLKAWIELGFVQSNIFHKPIGLNKDERKLIYYEFNLYEREHIKERNHISSWQFNIWPLTIICWYKKCCVITVDTETAFISKATNLSRAEAILLLDFWHRNAFLHRTTHVTSFHYAAAAIAFRIIRFSQSFYV